ncbi:unnamed protein product [Blepharisma stoltei]|uniref:protein-serine/threonine phosphatase n=1 Tax=Blepharisma stoltei TaxID=1481888 RepID=A0AAU9IZ43_9CILI|nr:unnamed protein product [Blepharisma stoltei]
MKYQKPSLSRSSFPNPSRPAILQGYKSLPKLEKLMLSPHYSEPPETPNHHAVTSRRMPRSGSETPIFDRLPPIQPSYSSTNLKINQYDSIPNLYPAKFSDKRCGNVRLYAVNTHEGLIRKYNEDRVSIVINIRSPPERANEPWPKCSFYGIYDGHGGCRCADFLKDNLHNFVIRDPHFPKNPTEALINGFKTAEREFLHLAQQNNDKSGSCATVCLVVNTKCFVANVGDSRSVLSSERGLKIYPLTEDHKPGEEPERSRILNSGGKIYTSASIPSNSAKQGLQHVYRILPGRLSVSRSFGDIEAKDEHLGGNPKCLIADPDIKAFKIQDEHDFIAMGCDGIFDRMTNKEMVECIWNSVTENFLVPYPNKCAEAVNDVIRSALRRRSMDNLTLILIGLKGLKKHAKQARKTVSLV